MIKINKYDNDGLWMGGEGYLFACKRLHYDVCIILYEKQARMKLHTRVTLIKAWSQVKTKVKSSQAKPSQVKSDQIKFTIDDARRLDNSNVINFNTRICFIPHR